MNFNESYNRYYRHFEQALSVACAEMDYKPPVLTESMRYSLLSGGKRVRPVLLFGALDALGLDFQKETKFAIAIEAIHTYSLIHDDLPAMDNDDFRRGKASSHKAFGEANAILAGDALLSWSFDLLLSECGKGEKHIEAAREISCAAGAEGMIAGQSADLLYTGKNGGEDELRFIYERKTGRLIEAPVAAAAILAGRAEREMRIFGENLGMLFQLTDDILDEKGSKEAMGKTLGKDKQEDKLTCVKVYGMDRAEKLADEYADKCRGALCGLNGTEFLEGFVALVRGRNH